MVASKHFIGNPVFIINFAIFIKELYVEDLLISKNGIHKLLYPNSFKYCS